MKSLELSTNILEELKKKDIVSGSELSAKYSISRTAVWKKIKILKNEGYDIKSIPRKGYLLADKKECFTPEEIFLKLNTKRFVKEIFFSGEAGSTNDLAYQYALKNKREGVVFIAEFQTEGRGRMGRQWFSPGGKGLWFSIILRPEIDISDLTILPLLTAVSCASAIKRITGLDTRIKWPNDLLVNGKKAGGILLEMKAEIDKIDFLVAGIGINVNVDKKDYPEYLTDKATSLKMEKGCDVSRAGLLAEILKNMGKNYSGYPGNKNDIIKEYSGICSNLGENINIETQAGVIKGRAVKIDENGCLLLKNEQGKIQRISSGDII